MLYEMVAGRAPFSWRNGERSDDIDPGEEAPSLGNQIAKIPAELGEIIKRTLRKESEERYQSARELIDALKAVRREWT